MSNTNTCCGQCGQGNTCTSSFSPSSLNQEGRGSSIPSVVLAPNSGLFINSLGQLDINCAVLGSKCNWPVTTGEPPAVNYNWTVAPATITAGNQVTVNVSGLAPSGLFALAITPTTGPVEYASFVADIDGNIVNRKIRLSTPQSSVMFTPMYAGGTPNISQYSVQVLACGESPLECSCRGAVTITPLLTASSVVSGQNVGLLLVIKNSNTCPITNLNLPALALPQQFTSAGPISLSNITVPGRGSQTVEFTLQAQNTTPVAISQTITVPAASAQFVCDGGNYSAGGGSVSISVAPATGSFCALAVESFGFTPGIVQSGVATTLTLTVKNTGSTPLLNVAMPSLALGGPGVVITAGATSIGFASIASLAPGASHSVSVSVTYTVLGALPYAHTITIPAGYIYATCNSSQISSGTSISANLSLTS